VGTDARADELAVDILLAGGEVVWSGIAPAPFLRAEGDEAVHGLRVGGEQVAVDCIAIAVGRQADVALATMCGASLGFSAALGGLVPVLDERLQTSVPNVYVAGDAAGAGSVAAAIAEGRLAGLAAAGGQGSEQESGDELAWRRRERAAMTARFVQPYE
jgi:pyruvate/2-oxoglutarate dehydrogenase complex dihydrolipoamide dehydrogenase (E3) component